MQATKNRSYSSMAKAAVALALAGLAAVSYAQGGNDTQETQMGPGMQGNAMQMQRQMRDMSRQMQDMAKRMEGGHMTRQEMQKMAEHMQQMSKNMSSMSGMMGTMGGGDGDAHPHENEGQKK